MQTHSYIFMYVVYIYIYIFKQLAIYSSSYTHTYNEYTHEHELQWLFSRYSYSPLILRWFVAILKSFQMSVTVYSFQITAIKTREHSTPIQQNQQIESAKYQKRWMIRKEKIYILTFKCTILTFCRNYFCSFHFCTFTVLTGK